MSFLDRIKDLESQGFCNICLTPITINNQYAHESCKVFSGIDFEEDQRSKLSKIRLEEYNEDYLKLITTALYTLLIPWDLQKNEIVSWFNNIETILLYFMVNLPYLYSELDTFF